MFLLSTFALLLLLSGWSERPVKWMHTLGKHQCFCRTVRNLRHRHLNCLHIFTAIGRRTILVLIQIEKDTICSVLLLVARPICIGECPPRIANVTEPWSPRNLRRILGQVSPSIAGAGGEKLGAKLFHWSQSGWFSMYGNVRTTQLARRS